MKKNIKQLTKEASISIDLLDSEILLCFVLDKEKIFLRAHPEYVVSFFDRLKFYQLVKKRKTGIPVSYLIGYKEFFGLKFFVNKYTLVPRPDTEVMVEQVLKSLENKKTLLIDVGTGSGCIPVAILKSDKIKKLKNKLSCYATDISKGAIKVAKRNTEMHGIDIEFFHGNLLEPFIKNNRLTKDSKIIITANLPYLTEQQWEEEDSIKREPKSALVADNNGLALYEELLEQIKKDVKNSTNNVTCFMEIDPNQTEALRNRVLYFLPDAKIMVIKDYSGRDRIVRVDA